MGEIFEDFLENLGRFFGRIFEISWAFEKNQHRLLGLELVYQRKRIVKRDQESFE